MVRRRLLEPAVIIVVSLLGLLDAYRLSGVLRSRAFHDVIGPDRYLAAVSFALLICGICLLRSTFSARQAIAIDSEKQQDVGTVVLLVGVVAAYAVLLPVLGYVLDTLLFFPVVFFIFGVRPWRKSIAIGVLTCAVFYAVFVHFGSVSFPKGVIGIF